MELMRIFGSQKTRIVSSTGLAIVNWDSVLSKEKNCQKQDKMNCLKLFTRFKTEKAKIKQKYGFTVG